MMSRFSSFVLALLLLVASGQVMAATYYTAGTAATATTLTLTSTNTFVKAANWTLATCGLATRAAISADVTISNGDTFVVCGSHTLAVTAATATVDAGTGKTITLQVESTGTVTADSTNKLVFGSTGTGKVINNGIITLTNTDNVALTLTGTYTAGTTGVLNSTCESVGAGGAWTAAATWGTATAACGVTVGAGSSPPLPTANSAVIIASTTAVTAGTGTVKSLTFKASVAGLLTLSGPLTVGSLATPGNIVFTGATGSILTASGQTITLSGNLTTIAATNIAGTTAPNLTLTDADHTLTIDGTTQPITLGTLTLTPPTASTTERTITVGTNGINVTSYSLGACATAASGTTASTFSATAPQIPAATYYCKLAPVVPGVAAPLFSTKEKAAVFSQEVK